MPRLTALRYGFIYLKTIQNCKCPEQYAQIRTRPRPLHPRGFSVQFCLCAITWMQSAQIWHQFSKNLLALILHYLQHLRSYRLFNGNGKPWDGSLTEQQVLTHIYSIPYLTTFTLKNKLPGFEYSVTCLTKGNDRIQDTVGNNCNLFLEQQVSWIRSQATIVERSSVSIGTARCCKGRAMGNSESVTCRQRKKSVSGVRSDQCEVVLIAIVICV
jgi:hypothetical protein